MLNAKTLNVTRWMMGGALVLLLHGSKPAGAVEYKTVVDAQLMGGQNFYNGADDSFGGLASLTVSPYTKFNDRWSLVPIYAGAYHGTKQVTDLIGGGTLFQDSQGHTLSTKLIRSFENGIKVKGSAGYGFELLRETEDEDWGKGLYDNQRLFGGVESEWSWASDRYVRLALDLYRIHFPNYASLESSQVDDGLGRELSEPDVLNNVNQAVTVGTRLSLPWRGFADLNGIFTFRQYRDQHLVVASGDLVPETRDDDVQVVSAQGTWPVWVKKEKRLFLSTGYTWSHLDSNQNNYDAAQTRFNPNFYSYMTHSLSQHWTLVMGPEAKTWTLSLGGAVSRQNYTDRLAQDAAGVYGGDTTHVDSAYMGLGASYPIAQGFRLAADVYLGWSDSNNHDHRVYQYHYNTQTYLMGFAYAY